MLFFFLLCANALLRFVVRALLFRCCAVFDLLFIFTQHLHKPTQSNPIQSHRIQPKVARATPKREQAGEEAAAGAAAKEAGKEAAKEAGKEAGKEADSLQRVHSTIH